MDCVKIQVFHYSRKLKLNNIIIIIIIIIIISRDNFMLFQLQFSRVFSTLR
jgi:hypothetical protein